MGCGVSVTFVPPVSIGISRVQKKNILAAAGSESSSDVDAVWTTAGIRLVQESGGRNDHLNALWEHPASKAKVFVGDELAAKKWTILGPNNIKAVVNCTKTDIRNFHAGSGAIRYLRFPVADHHRSHIIPKTETLANTYRLPSTHFRQ